MSIHYTLNPSDLSIISRVVDDLSRTFSSVEDQRFLCALTPYAQQLPAALRKSLNTFRLADEDSDFAVISGYPIDSSSIGPTPTHWDNRSEISPTLKEEIYLMLVGDLLGDAFGWATQQAGYVCHDLLPVEGLENEQTGASSTCVLAWHTEDAFHPLKGDYLGLMCLRNPDNTATTIGSLDLSLLSDEVIEVLFQPRFSLKPDLTHKPAFKSRSNSQRDVEPDRLESSYNTMNAIDRAPPKTPILYGRRDAPYICVDPVFIEFSPDDREGPAALEALTQALDDKLQDVVLHPGDLVFLDNARVVHGRQSFSPRYDGSDRWLKRVNLTTDLRKSFPARGGDSRRLIF